MATTPKMTLDELLEKIPDEFKPVAKQYAPIFLTWTYEEIWAWIDLLGKYKFADAYRRLVEAMSNDELLAEFDKNAMDYKKETARLEIQREVAWQAMMATLKAAVTIALALLPVGL